MSESHSTRVRELKEIQRNLQNISERLTPEMKRLERIEVNTCPKDPKDDVELDHEEKEFFTRLKLSHHSAFQASRIDEALLRFELGTYGVCGACEEEIEIARLRAQPTAQFCVDCQEASENHEVLSKLAEKGHRGAIARLFRYGEDRCV